MRIEQQFSRMRAIMLQVIAIGWGLAYRMMKWRNGDGFRMRQHVYIKSRGYRRLVDFLNYTFLQVQVVP